MNSLRIAHLEHGLEYLESQTVKTFIQRAAGTILDVFYRCDGRVRRDAHRRRQFSLGMGSPA